MSEIEQLLKTAGYSTKAIAFYLNNVNVGTCADADICVGYTGICGDTMEFFLKIDSNRIQEAKFQALGCEGAFICGSAVTEMVHGMPLTEAERIEPDQVIAYLGEIPGEKHDCARLAVKTLRNTLAEFKKNQTEVKKI